MSLAFGSLLFLLAAYISARKAGSPYNPLTVLCVLWLIVVFASLVQFGENPIQWVLLAVAASLAVAAVFMPGELHGERRVFWRIRKKRMLRIVSLLALVGTLAGPTAWILNDVDPLQGQPLELPRLFATLRYEQGVMGMETVAVLSTCSMTAAILLSLSSVCGLNRSYGVRALFVLIGPALFALMTTLKATLLITLCILLAGIFARSHLRLPMRPSDWWKRALWIALVSSLVLYFLTLTVSIRSEAYTSNLLLATEKLLSYGTLGVQGLALWDFSALVDSPGKWTLTGRTLAGFHDPFPWGQSLGEARLDAVPVGRFSTTVYTAWRDLVEDFGPLFPLVLGPIVIGFGYAWRAWRTSNSPIPGLVTNAGFAAIFFSPAASLFTQTNVLLSYVVALALVPITTVKTRLWHLRLRDHQKHYFENCMKETTRVNQIDSNLSPDPARWRMASTRAGTSLLALPAKCGWPTSPNTALSK